MTSFALEELEEIVGRIKFFKLVIDGVCEYDEFCNDIKQDGNLEKQLVTINARMDDLANLRMMPSTKFRDVTPKKEVVKEYEIKTSDLRVYIIKDDRGNLVITGGKKSTQDQDFKHFRSIKKAYLKSKK